MILYFELIILVTISMVTLTLKLILYNIIFIRIIIIEHHIFCLIFMVYLSSIVVYTDNQLCYHNIPEKGFSPRMQKRPYSMYVESIITLNSSNVRHLFHIMINMVYDWLSLIQEDSQIYFEPLLYCYTCNLCTERKTLIKIWSVHVYYILGFLMTS